MSELKHQSKNAEDFKNLPIIGERPNSKKEEEFLRQVCEFEFLNLEEPGVAHRFPYGNAKRSITFTLFHGGKYKVPRFIARWIESRTIPIWDWRPNGIGQLEKKLIGRNPRFQMREVFGGE